MTESSAVLMKDDKVVAAVEEERFSRVKHDGGFPYASIASVLNCQNLTLSDIDHVAVYWNPYKVGHRARCVLESLMFNPKVFLERMQRALTIWTDSRGQDSGWASLFRTQQNLKLRFGSAPKKISFFDHHQCHMASCFYASPFSDSAILVMDGAGEAACTTWGVGSGRSMQTIDEHLLPHSLGHFYSSVTGYLGFKMLDGEYKLMGLSPYGDPSGAAWMKKNFLQSADSGRYQLKTEALDYLSALKGRFEGDFAKYFGPPRPFSETAEFTDRHRDIAASAQSTFEGVVMDMAKELRKRTQMKKLSIAGGCGLNCTANGKILLNGIFEEIYVPPVPHDVGGALGAAMLAYVKLTGQRPVAINHAQFGPEFSNQDIASALERHSEVVATKLDANEIVSKAAQHLSQSKVIAWFQGRMEYGPRALGNRSFLADPRSDSIRNVINNKIKKRELFRPFAPSVKAEKSNEYFDIDQASPFMTIVTPVKENKRNEIPAVTHIDGTARPQTVERSVNEKYWKLLDSFESLTGVPVLLNTSFNIQEPIVTTPSEALATFSKSGVDALAIGDYWVTHRTMGDKFS